MTASVSPNHVLAAVPHPDDWREGTGLIELLLLCVFLRAPTARLPYPRTAQEAVARSVFGGGVAIRDLRSHRVNCARNWTGTYRRRPFWHLQHDRRGSHWPRILLVDDSSGPSLAIRGDWNRDLERIQKRSIKEK
jgi:hypothetical protein